MTDKRPDSPQSLAEALMRLPEAERDHFLTTLTLEELKLIEADLAHVTPVDKSHVLPHQVIPLDGARGHLFTGGRRAGKTHALSANAVEHMKGAPCDHSVEGGHRVLAVSPTAADAISALHYGPSGITALWPGCRLSQGSDGAHLVTPSGVRVRLIGAFGPEDVERARAAGGTCLVLCDELATWKREEIWSNILFGLSLGPYPRWIAATTPKNRKLFKKLLNSKTVTHSHATFRDNPFISQAVKDELEAEYAGTRTGQQELEGLLVEDVEGAFWTAEMIEECQGGLPRELRRVVVGVDPSGSESGDETGIVTGGIDGAEVVHILEDVSRNGTPDQRFEAVCMTAHRHSAGLIVHEAQFSGDNYGFAIAQKWKELAEKGKVSAICPRIKRTAARGSKASRAESLAGLYEQGRVKHVPGLSALEDQQTTWEAPSVDPDSGKIVAGSKWSPDRIDAEGYLVRELLSGRGGSISMDGGLTSEGATLLAEAAEAGGSQLDSGLLFGGETFGLHPALDGTFSVLDRAFAGAVGIDVDGHGDGADFDSFDGLDGLN